MNNDTLFVGIECLFIGTLIGMWIAHRIDKPLIKMLKKLAFKEG